MEPATNRGFLLGAARGNSSIYPNLRGESRRGKKPLPSVPLSSVALGGTGIDFAIPAIISASHGSTPSPGGLRGTISLRVIAHRAQ